MRGISQTQNARHFEFNSSSSISNCIRTHIFAVAECRHSIKYAFVCVNSPWNWILCSNQFQFFFSLCFHANHQWDSAKWNFSPHFTIAHLVFPNRVHSFSHILPVNSPSKWTTYVREPQKRTKIAAKCEREKFTLNTVALTLIICNQRIECCCSAAANDVHKPTIFGMKNKWIWISAARALFASIANTAKKSSMGKPKLWQHLPLHSFSISTRVLRVKKTRLDDLARVRARRETNEWIKNTGSRRKNTQDRIKKEDCD